MRARTTRAHGHWHQDLSRRRHRRRSRGCLTSTGRPLASRIATVGEGEHAAKPSDPTLACPCAIGSPLRYGHQVIGVPPCFRVPWLAGPQARRPAGPQACRPLRAMSQVVSAGHAQSRRRILSSRSYPATKSSIWATSAGCRRKPKTARSACRCSASVVPVSGIMPTSNANLNTICGIVRQCRAKGCGGATAFSTSVAERNGVRGGWAANGRPGPG